MSKVLKGDLEEITTTNLYKSSAPIQLLHTQGIFAPQVPVSGESGEPLQMQGANDSPRKTISIHSQTLKTVLTPDPRFDVNTLYRALFVFISARSQFW